ncbi:replication initiator protein [Saccharomonospora piscinae]|uniref:Replication initiator protein n=1 Tax=Saccharomonospora piscinae TaxID=687388 RepID=A0A1V9A5N2_SACPI|nr:replication initiator [Saccharomonospora piscinae]OQO92447.1 replication initiator protein [Saccharomonospora piscinae]
MSSTVTPMPGAQSRAERMRQPLSSEVVAATADKHGVCVRPFTMEVTDPDTARVRYVPVPCGSTVESVCGPCARKAKALRQTQCREGWHLTEEPDFTPDLPTRQQTELLEYRADLVRSYRQAQDEGEEVAAEEVREEIRGVDDELRASGVRGRLPLVDPPAQRPKKRSTKRRQDAPNLPRRMVEKRTIGREYAGGFRPSMFVTLTLDTYGRVRQDGTPVDPATYDYRRAARDAVHFSALVDRWWQNLRRVVGWDVQYFATVEPQRRAAPHLHAAVRGSLPHEVIRQVTAATYHQVWWPEHDRLVYSGEHLPVWDADRRVFTDPDTRQPLTQWDDALDAVQAPAHVVTFGEQVHSKGILGGTRESGRHIGYLTKYLTKATGEVVESAGQRQRYHHDRLHAELAVTPCSRRCAVWLLYGIQPLGVGGRTVPGRCKGRAHRRTTLGLPGRRVLVSRKWSGKSLADHRTDRKAFVRDMLASVGIEKPEQDTSRLVWRKLAPGDRAVPPRDQLLMRSIAERITWRAEYDRALLAAQPPPGGPETSATRRAA